MIRRPDPRVLEALMALEHNGHFKDILQWVEGSLSDTTARCIEETDETALRQAQGAAQDLRTLIKEAREARGNLERIRQQTP